jgi:hypothetical protein
MKLKIIEYFDSLVSKIDLLVELYIDDNLQNQTLVDKVNKARLEWLKEIEDCLKFNISKCTETKEDAPPIEDTELFERFCFLIEFNGDVLMSGRFTWRLISTDMYLRPGQIEFFQEVLKFTNIDHEKENIDEPLTTINRFFPNIKVNL